MAINAIFSYSISSWSLTWSFHTPPHGVRLPERGAKECHSKPGRTGKDTEAEGRVGMPGFSTSCDTCWGCAWEPGLGWEGSWRPGGRSQQPTAQPLKTPSSFGDTEKGSSSCKVRPACTDKDYFYTHTACDANGEVSSAGSEPLCRPKHVIPCSPAPPAGECQWIANLEPEKNPQTCMLGCRVEGQRGKT